MGISGIGWGGRGIRGRGWGKGNLSGRGGGRGMGNRRGLGTSLQLAAEYKKKYYKNQNFGVPHLATFFHYNSTYVNLSIRCRGSNPQPLGHELSA